MVAGATALDEVLTAPALAELNALGDRLRTQLNTGFRDAGALFHVTGLGSVNQIHYTASPKEDEASALALLYFSLIERGFWIAQRGTVVLNLATTAEDVDEFVRAVVSVATEMTGRGS